MAKSRWDQTSIHPESYGYVNELLDKVNLTYDYLGTDELKEALNSLSISDLSEELGVGEFTLKDIIQALVQPGRDPRDDLPKPLLKKIFCNWRIYRKVFNLKEPYAMWWILVRL